MGTGTATAPKTGAGPFSKGCKMESSGSEQVVNSKTERAWAYTSFWATYDLHCAALHGLSCLAVSDGGQEFLKAEIRLSNGWDRPQQADRRAAAIKVFASEEVARKFITLRPATLISLCGGVEWLVKAAFVDMAFQDPQPICEQVRSRWYEVGSQGRKVKALNWIEANCSLSEWYVRADALWKQLGREDGLGVLDRVCAMLTELSPRIAQDAAEIKSELAKVKVNHREHLQEAFLVRNCLVHNGCSVNRKLAELNGFVIDERLSISEVDMRRYVTALHETAIAVGVYSLSDI